MNKLTVKKITYDTKENNYGFSNLVVYRAEFYVDTLDMNYTEEYIRYNIEGFDSNVNNFSDLDIGYKDIIISACTAALHGLQDVMHDINDQETRNRLAKMLITQRFTRVSKNFETIDYTQSLFEDTISNIGLAQRLYTNVGILEFILETKFEY